MTDSEKDKVLREFAAKMQKVRDAQPTDSDIQVLRTATAYLLDIAERGTGQSVRVRSFLLAWWNAEQCGGFDLTDLWNLDMEIVEQIHRLLLILPNYRFYPDKLGFGERFEEMAHAWCAGKR